VQFQSNVLIFDYGYSMWIPCTIYKSSCTINVEHFPFDEQKCEFIFGSWTYNGDEITLKPYTDRFVKVSLISYYYLSVKTTICLRFDYDFTAIRRCRSTLAKWAAVQPYIAKQVKSK